MGAVWTMDGDETSWTAWAEARAGAPASPLIEDLVAAHPTAGGWALDLGCGTGRAFTPLATAGYRVIGLDPTPRAVVLSGERTAAEGLPAWPVQASAARLPLRARSISFVLALATLFHLSPAELAEALAEIRRVLEPGGTAVLHLLDVDDWRHSLAGQVAPEAVPVPGYRAVVTCFCTPETIAQWLAAAGLVLQALVLRTSESEAGQQRNWLATCTAAG